MSTTPAPLVDDPIVNRMATSLLEASRAEGTGRILEVSYTKPQYIHRRHGYLGGHRDYKNLPHILPSIRRAADEIFDYEAGRADRLSSEQVRLRELDRGIEPLLPFSTASNTQTIDSFASYGGVELAAAPSPAYPASAPRISASEQRHLDTATSPAPLGIGLTQDYSDDETVSDMFFTPRSTPSETTRLSHAQHLAGQALPYTAGLDKQTTNFDANLSLTSTGHQVSNQHLYVQQDPNNMQNFGTVKLAPESPQVLAQIIADLGRKDLTPADAPAQYRHGNPGYVPMTSQAPEQLVQGLAQYQHGDQILHPAQSHSPAPVLQAPPQLQNAPITHTTGSSQTPAEVQHATQVASSALNDNLRQPQQGRTTSQAEHPATDLPQISGSIPLTPEPGAQFELRDGTVSAAKVRAVNNPVKLPSSKKRPTPDNDEVDTEGQIEAADVESTLMEPPPKTKKQKTVASPPADDNTAITTKSNAEETGNELDNSTPHQAPPPRSKGVRTVANKAPRKAPPKAPPKAAIVAGPDRSPSPPQSKRRPAKTNSRTTSLRESGSKSSAPKSAPATPTHPTTGGKSPLHPASNMNCVNGTRLPRSKAEAIDSAAVRRQLLLVNYDGGFHHPDLGPEFFDKSNFTRKEKQEIEIGGDGGPVRCVCGEAGVNVDKEWIGCETKDCGVWQHIDCMGAGVPKETERQDKHYYCQQCDPYAHRHLIKKLRREQPLQ